MLDLPTELDLPTNAVEALLRIVREAINNVGRHGDADTVWVTVSTGDAIAVTIADDGEGFDATVASSGFGLTSMRERTEALGGVFTVTTAAGQGATIRVDIPWR
jgi:signal transduction histidine kinase